MFGIFGGANRAAVSIASDTGTHGRLDTTNAGLVTVDNDLNVGFGADGTGAPATGSGVRGWLHSIYDKLSGTLTVSAASLPLPSGAATSANQTNGTQVTSVNNFPATQPVSGTVTANAGTGTFTVDASGHTVPVSATALPLPTGAATEAGLGTDGGGESPANGTGIRGWLRSIYDKLASSVAVTQSGGWSVTANAGTNLNTSALALETGGHLADIDTLLTNGTAKTQLSDSFNSVQVNPADKNALYTSTVTKTITQTISSTGSSPTVDTLGYSWVEFSSTAITSLTITPQMASDAGFSVSSQNAPYWFLNNAAPAVMAAGARAMGSASVCLIIPVTQEFLRMNVTTLTGGPATFTYVLHTGPLPTLGPAIQPASQSGTWTMTQGGGTAQTNVWATGGGSAATSNNASTSATTGSTITYLNAEAYWGMQVVVGGTGSLSALTVILEGSLDGGTTWSTIATTTGTTTGTYGSNPTSTPMPFLLVRSRITVFTAASGSPTVTTKIAGTM